MYEVGCRRDCSRPKGTRGGTAAIKAGHVGEGSYRMGDRRGVGGGSEEGVTISKKTNSLDIVLVNAVLGWEKGGFAVTRGHL